MSGYTSYYPVITGFERSMPFYVSAVGTTEREGPIRRPAGKHEYQILFSSAGAGYAVLKKRLHRVEAGDLLYHTPFEAQDYYPQSGEWTTHWIVFSGTGVGDLLPFESGIFKTDYYKCLAFFNELVNLERDDKWLENSTVILYRMLLWCKFSVFSAAKSRSIHRTKERLRPAIEFMEKNHTSPPDLSTLAKLLNISEGQFCRLFRTAYNARPIEYFNLLRIQQSKELLLRNRLATVSEISRMAGFESPSYYCKLFKRYEGITPNEFRCSNS